jgi:hypothetical protein
MDQAQERTSPLFDASKPSDPEEVVAKIRAMSPAEQGWAVAELQERAAAAKQRAEAAEAEAAALRAEADDAEDLVAAAREAWVQAGAERQRAAAAAERVVTWQHIHGEYRWHVDLACSVILDAW